MPIVIAQETVHLIVACPACSGTGSTRQDFYPVPVWTRCTCCAASA